MKLPRLSLRWPQIIVLPKPSDAMPSLGKRLLWMAGIWVASVLALLAVALLLRWVLER